jgi:hypothetical protein
MPLDNETLSGLKEALGDAGAELYAKVSGAVASDVAEFDKLRSGHQSAASKQTELKGQLKAAVTERDKWKADFETASSDDALLKMTEARDKQTKEAGDWKSQFEGLTKNVRDGKIASKLATALFTDADGNPIAVKPAKREAALELLTGRGLPEGVDLDDKGGLIGHVAPLEAFRQKYGFMLSVSADDDDADDGDDGRQVDDANTGKRPGAGVKPKARGKQTKKDAAQILREEGAKMAGDYLDHSADPFRRKVAASK